MKTIKERLLDNVEMKRDCWIWTAGKSHNGYGKIEITGNGFKRTERAHRVSYQQFVGPIPKGLLVLHSCDNPSCINPDHLFIGTQKDNIRDREDKKRGNNANAKKTHCPRGHEYNEENTYMNGDKRVCRICRYINNRQRYKNLKSKTNNE